MLVVSGDDDELSRALIDKKKLKASINEEPDELSPERKVEKVVNSVPQKAKVNNPPKKEIPTASTEVLAKKPLPF